MSLLANKLSYSVLTHVPLLANKLPYSVLTHVSLLANKLSFSVLTHVSLLVNFSYSVLSDMHSAQVSLPILFYANNTLQYCLSFSN